VVDALLDREVPPHAVPSVKRAVRTAAIWLAIWLGPVLALAALLGPDHVYTHIATFFSQVAVVTFGGAYAVLAYIAQEAVEHYHWLQPPEMLDGLGLAETTPGPLIMVVEFVGFLAAYRNPGALHPILAGTLGATLTTWVTFAPCFLWIFVGAPWVEALRGKASLSAALSAITAAVVGVIANLAVWFGIHVLFAESREVGPLGWDVPVLASIQPLALVVMLGAAVALLRYHLGMIPVLAASAAVGLLAWAVGLA
jgi:chromate transporter